MIRFIFVTAAALVMAAVISSPSVAGSVGESGYKNRDAPATVDGAAAAVDGNTVAGGG